jgi:uncharacterized protein YfdQ (DUF2303 family)
MPNPKQIKATTIASSEDALEVQLEDGGAVIIPLDWYIHDYATLRQKPEQIGA